VRKRLFRHVYTKTRRYNKTGSRQTYETVEASEVSAGGAYAAGEEARLGQIAPGFAADLTIVDVDVSADPALLATAQVEQVWVAGIPRFDRRHAKGMLPPGAGNDFLSRFYNVQTIILPRQARDKHKQTHQQREMCLSHSRAARWPVYPRQERPNPRAVRVA
jgi:hypothetical protein